MEEVQAFGVDQKVGQASGDPKKVGEHKKEGIWLLSLHFFLPKKSGRGPITYILCSSSV
jgi:hypothetical protein